MTQKNSTGHNKMRNRYLNVRRKYNKDTKKASISVGNVDVFD